MEIMPFILRLQKEKGNDLWAKWVTYLAYEECDGWHCCNYSCEQSVSSCGEYLRVLLNMLECIYMTSCLCYEKEKK